MGILTKKEITEKLEEVLSDPKLFKNHYKDVKTVFEKFDKNQFFMGQKVALKILKVRPTNIGKKETRIAGQLLKKYRSVLLGQDKVSYSYYIF